LEELALSLSALKNESHCELAVIALVRGEYDLRGLSRLLNLSLKINPLTLWVRALPLFKSLNKDMTLCVCYLTDRQTYSVIQPNTK